MGIHNFIKTPMKYQVSFRAKTWYLHMWKKTCYLHIWKFHRCYVYIINGAFHTKKLLKWNGLVFHWCFYNKQSITWPLEDTKFLFACWKNISLVRCPHSWNTFQHSKRSFVSPRGHVISSMYPPSPSLPYPLAWIQQSVPLPPAPQLKNCRTSTVLSSILVNTFFSTCSVWKAGWSSSLAGSSHADLLFTGSCLWRTDCDVQLQWRA